jgi:RES domain-containing protein
VQYQGLLYRAINPLYAADPLSGEGARRFGGRFNAKGVPALYTCLAPETALNESHQVGHLQPTVLVSYHANLAPVFDATAVEALAAFNLTPADLSVSDWREQMLTTGKSNTQAFADELISAGYNGMLHPSYALAAATNALNLVLWQWNTSTTNTLDVIDDEKRLPLK